MGKFETLKSILAKSKHFKDTKCSAYLNKSIQNLIYTGFRTEAWNTVSCALGSIAVCLFMKKLLKIHYKMMTLFFLVYDYSKVRLNI